MKLIFNFYILLLLQVSCNSQSFIKQRVPLIYKNTNKTSKVIINSEITTLKAKAFKLEQALPKNYDITGKVDYTAIIQDVIDRNSCVVFPDFPLLINSKGLTLISNSKLFFGKKSKLFLLGNDEAGYEVLRIHNINDVSLYAPTIIGERDAHIGTKGEWGMGISIRGSEEVNIYNANISNCWGDGIYIGTGKGINKNIVIKKCLFR